MALNKERLKEKIIGVLDECRKETDNPEASRDKFATELANAIDEFVKSGEVIVNQGITLQAGTYTGTTTSKGKGKIM